MKIKGKTIGNYVIYIMGMQVIIKQNFLILGYSLRIQKKFLARHESRLNLIESFDVYRDGELGTRCPRFLRSSQVTALQFFALLLLARVDDKMAKKEREKNSLSYLFIYFGWQKRASRFIACREPHKGTSEKR